LEKRKDKQKKWRERMREQYQRKNTVKVKKKTIPVITGRGGL
jgi:hypothetical protein